MSNGSDIGSQYSFLPYLRRGLSAYFVAKPGETPSQSIPTRAQLNVQLNVSAFDADNKPLPGVTPSPTLTVSMYGPADIIGFNPDNVVKTEPLNLSTTFEPDYFPAIEFDQPDFPWLFSPMSAPDTSQNQRLMPWIVLIVLADGEFTEAPGGSGPSYVDVPDSSVLPNLAQSWCWAHTQITGSVLSGDISSVLTSAPQQFISRLLCPRHLAPNTHYTGFVVPSFDAGVAAGLGQPPSPATSLNSAWSGAGAVRLPYYFGGKGRFEFYTSSAGDFESLVRMMKRRAEPLSAGTRPMSVKGASNGRLPDDPSESPMQLGGALQADLAASAWNDGDPFKRELSALLTSAATYSPQRTTSGDPKVAPPFYGRWHKGVNAVGPRDSGWLAQVNLDPRNRAVAGFGVWIVLKERNQLMQSAWQQLQSIQKANQTLRSLQLARGVTQELYKKNFCAADAPTLLAWTQNVQRRIVSKAANMASAVAHSALPWRLLTAAGRRWLRPYAPQRCRASTSGRPYDIFQKINKGTIEIVPPTQPQGSISYTSELNTLYPKWLPARLRPFLPYLTWGLLALWLLIAILTLIFAGPALAGIVLAILAAPVWFYWNQIRKAQQINELISGVQPQNLNQSAFTNAPPQPTFGVVSFASPPVVWTGGSGWSGGDSPAASAFRSAATKLMGAVEQTQKQANAVVPPAPLSLDDFRQAILASLNPDVTLTARARALVHLDASLGWPPASVDPLEPVMAYPKFDQPMYEALRDWSEQILMPGISEIPDNSMTILEDNHAFIEAYMLGLNVEMGRQLLWNGFPTDQRGSYFRQFWDISAVYPQPSTAAQREALYDIPPIDQWPISTILRNNLNAGQKASVVLLLRGQLLKRYPTTHIYACPAQLVDGKPELLGGGTDPSNHVQPIYRGTLSPDVTFIGFPLTETELRSGGPTNQGYFFVFEQVPGELRFGLEPVAAKVGSVKSWSQLSWANLSSSGPGPIQYADPTESLTGIVALTGSDANYRWNTEAAQTAYITFRPPARVAVLAEKMLNTKSS